MGSSRGQGFRAWCANFLQNLVRDDAGDEPSSLSPVCQKEGG
ncbi:hypothetical protein PCLA_01r0686 [Pseudomonas citronellolis]|nr:hypothetical protein PCLA_01r0686 [Pseudomonas citronellolis]